MAAAQATRGNASTDRIVCVVLHDVAASTRAACLRVLEAIAEVAELPVTLLAVPRYHDETPTPEFEAWLGQRSRRGDELALHGWTHRDDLPPAGTLDRLRRRHYTRSEGEFWALPEAEASRRIDAGIAWFQEHGWPLAGFVAPAWLLGPTDVQLSRYISIAGWRITASTMSEKRPATCGRIASRI